MAKGVIGPLRSEAEYEAAVDEIEACFDREPKPGTPDANRFDLLAVLIADYGRLEKLSEVDTKMATVKNAA